MGETQDAFYRLVPHIIDIQPGDDGIISYADRRFVFFHTDMFARLFENMREVTGPVIDRKVQSFGEEAGKEIASKMDAAFSGTSLSDGARLLVDSGFDFGALQRVTKQDTRSQMEKIFGYGRYVGWVGPIELVSYEEGEARFAVSNSFESDSYGETGEHQCRFLSGVLKGMLSYYWDADDLTVEEETCRCAGDETCEMVVSRGA